jgi:nucleotide sugar dehydrogenase
VAENTSGAEYDVCIVGLGYVGLTLATALAMSGLRVIGIERNAVVVDTVSAGKTPFHENGLDGAVAQVVSDGRLSAVNSAFAAPRAGAYVITVGTPLRNGKVQHGDIEVALRSVGEWMPDGALTVLRSTVRVGTTNNVARPILEATGKPFTLAMAPERTIEGKALAELTSLPQIVGGIDRPSLVAASELFGALGVEIVEVETVEAAETAKLASNTFRDLQFAFANELAYFADVVGVDIYEVIRACNYGYDRMNLALPGPVAGPCLEKDAYILDDSAKAFGTSVELSMQARRTNEAIVPHVVNIVRSRAQTTVTSVGILGLAFKGRPETSDTRGSLALDFARQIRAEWSSAHICGWDPLVSAHDAEAMAIAATTAVDLSRSSDVVIVQTNHPVFSSLEFLAMLELELPREALVIDLWNQMGALADRRVDLQIVALGRAALKVG